MNRALMIAGLGVMLSACQMVGPDYQVPEDAAVQRKDFQGELAVAGKPVVSAPVPADWWRLYRPWPPTPICASRRRTCNGLELRSMRPKQRAAGAQV
jgi:hypothetical protein